LNTTTQYILQKSTVVYLGMVPWFIYCLIYPNI